MIPGKEEFLKKQRFREETLFQKSRQRELPAFHMGKIKSIYIKQLARSIFQSPDS